MKDDLSVRKVEELIRKLSEPKKVKKSTLYGSLPGRDEVSNNAVEDKLRGILGTKVLCSQKKDGSGEIRIEYYSIPH